MVRRAGAPGKGGSRAGRYWCFQLREPAGWRRPRVAVDDHHHDGEHPRGAGREDPGQVFGLTVRSRSLGGNIAAFLKGLVGGEIRSYVKLNEDARRQAIDRMVQNAASMGANAVTMMRFDSTEMGASKSEIVAYGTARVVEWLPSGTTDRQSQERS